MGFMAHIGVVQGEFPIWREKLFSSTLPVVFDTPEVMAEERGGVSPGLS